VTVFDGTPVKTHDEFIQLIRNRRIGQELEVTFVRDGEEFTVPVTLIERPQ
ncbi:MAG: PDZ domain-containing protein, partial [Dehalococcoidia bacterium]